ncbi:MAG: hypothetical protein IPG14_08095 [Dehalococcoidia bacterium]|nr:hypothetical protein [Dehalococcoidia bacterium]
MKPRVVVVGSLMMDLVVRAPRLPVIGESLLSHSFRTSPGGKGGNQAIAAARLGASVTMIGQVGADRFGEILRERLEAEGVDTRFVSVDPELGTGVAVPIVLDSGENAIFAVPQANLTLSSSADGTGARCDLFRRHATRAVRGQHGRHPRRHAPGGGRAGPYPAEPCASGSLPSRDAGTRLRNRRKRDRGRCARSLRVGRPRRRSRSAPQDVQERRHHPRP